MPERVKNVKIFYTYAMILMWDELGPNVSYCIAVKINEHANETCEQNGTSFVIRNLDLKFVHTFVVTGVNIIGRGPPSYPLLSNISFGEWEEP